ncbi:MAG: hypothetical protein WCS09_21160 [Pseudomonadota bacterium]|jgi:hypothetical protein
MSSVTAPPAALASSTIAEHEVEQDVLCAEQQRGTRRGDDREQRKQREEP